MYSHCSYLIIDSLVPPSVDEDKSLLRLESLCACEIVRNDRSCELLSNVPTHLYKILWEAYLRYEFYAYRDRLDKHYESGNNRNNFSDSIKPELVLSGLPELLYHWPNEEFILKELMPKLPPRLNQHKHVYSFWKTKEFGDYYDQNKIFLLSFYECVVRTIIKMFTKSTNNIFSKQHTCTYHVRKVNLSGFHIFKWYCLEEDLDFMKGASTRNFPFLKNFVEGMEIILDYNIDDNIEFFRDYVGSDLKYLDEAAPPPKLFCNSPNSVLFKFGHISMYSPKGDFHGAWSPRFRGNLSLYDFKDLLEALVDAGATSLTLSGNRRKRTINVSEIMENICKNNENQANILAFKLDQKNFSYEYPVIKFVEYFRNLIHLDLSNIELRGGLCSLKNMQRGLLSLKLHNCELVHEDLAQLIDSCHQSTLKELDLSSNLREFEHSLNCNIKLVRYDTNLVRNVIKLCQNLTNIIHLDLESCNLGEWQSSDIVLLVDAFRKMTNIVYLNLNGNYFSHHNITSHIMSLNASPSLRYLKLTYPMPWQNSVTDEMKAFASEINTSMNRNRSQLLYVEFDNPWPHDYRR